MLPVLTIGPLALPVPALCVLLGAIISISIIERNADRQAIDANLLSNLIYTILIAGLAGARLAYLITYPHELARNPVSLLSLRPELLDPIGGSLVGIVAGLIFGQRKKLPFLATLDAFVPGLAFFSLSFALAHLASGAAFGAPSSLPWAIDLWGARRHPTQVYEALAALFILLVIWQLNKSTRRPPAGQLVCLFLTMSALGRLFLEAFRGDSYLTIWGLRSAQLAAWVIMAIGLWGLGKVNQRKKSDAKPS